MRAVLLLPLILLSSVALAQEAPASEAKVIYADRTELDFEGVDVFGQVVGPAMKLVVAQRKADFHPLIRLRTNFDAELQESVREVQ